MLLRLAGVNHDGKPYLKLKPPGGRCSPSLALIGPDPDTLAEREYVVKGDTSGWKMSLVKVTTGGEFG